MGGWVAQWLFKVLRPFLNISIGMVCCLFLKLKGGGFTQQQYYMRLTVISQNWKNLTSNDVMPNPIQIPIDVEM